MVGIVHASGRALLVLPILAAVACTPPTLSERGQIPRADRDLVAEVSVDSIVTRGSIEAAVYLKNTSKTLTYRYLNVSSDDEIVQLPYSLKLVRVGRKDTMEFGNPSPYLFEMRSELEIPLYKRGARIGPKERIGFTTDFAPLLESSEEGVYQASLSVWVPPGFPIISQPFVIHIVDGR